MFCKSLKKGIRKASPCKPLIAGRTKRTITGRSKSQKAESSAKRFIDFLRSSFGRTTAVCRRRMVKQFAVAGWIYGASTNRSAGFPESLASPRLFKKSIQGRPNKAAASGYLKMQIRLKISDISRASSTTFEALALPSSCKA